MALRISASRPHTWEARASKFFGKGAGSGPDSEWAKSIIQHQIRHIDPKDLIRECLGCGQVFTIAALQIRDGELVAGQATVRRFCSDCAKDRDDKAAYAALAQRYQLTVNEIRRIEYKHRTSIQTDRNVRRDVYRTRTMSVFHLLTLWRAQRGLCALSGLPMALIGAGKLRRPDYLAASIDRINSDRGYEDGNVQWTCWGANLMKQDMPQGEFLAFCRAIAKTHKPKKRRKTAPSLETLFGPDTSA